MGETPRGRVNSMSVMSEEVTRLCESAVGAMTRGDYPTAITTFEKVLRKDDKVALAWNNRGLCLLNLGHPFDGRMNIDKAIEADPSIAHPWNNRGACSYEMGDIEQALADYTKAIELFPEFPEAWNNVGNALKYQKKFPEAIVSYRKAVEVKPDYVDAHLHLAFSLLNTGQYEEGWKEFEWRWKSPQLPPRGLNIPEWNGEPLEGKNLLIYAEQGFGDALQFVRYAPLVKKQFNPSFLVVEVRNPLSRLCQYIEGIDQVISLGEKVPDVDYAVPMMTLPRIMGTTLETIPWSGPYFTVDQDLTSWFEKTALSRLPPGIRVGICWAGMSREGNPNASAVDRMRSTTLSSFAPSGLIPGISWVSLQKGPPAEQVKSPPAGMTIGDFTENLYDFYDTAALIQSLDLVITVDTAVVHLAAALGKPTWLISRWDGCWRWLGDRKDSPWYPTVRQFVQHAPNDWTGVMNEISIELRKFVQEHKVKAAA